MTRFASGNRGPLHRRPVGRYRSCSCRTRTPSTNALRLSNGRVEASTRYLRKRDSARASDAVVETGARDGHAVYADCTITGGKHRSDRRRINEPSVTVRRAGPAGNESTGARCCATRPVGAWPASRRRGWSERGLAQTRDRKSRMCVIVRGDTAPRKTPRVRSGLKSPVPAVPAIMNKPTLAREQALLHENKVHERRRTSARWSRASCKHW